MYEATDGYQFFVERVRTAVVTSAGGVIDESALEEDWQNLVNDGSEWAVLLTHVQLDSLSDALSVAASRHDLRHGGWHSKAATRLAKHDDCMAVVAELAAERDDIIDGIIQAREYACTDMYEGEYGDLLVSAEMFLDLLRPTLRGTRAYRSLDTASEWCPVCQEQWVHEDWCTVESRGDDLQRQRQHAVSSHLHCAEMGEALIKSTMQSLDLAELIARHVFNNTELIYGDEAFAPHAILPVMNIESLNVAFDGTPGSLSATIYPELEDPEYCHEEPFHASPHRACRDLIS